jgi:hypothetical protein
MTTTEEFHHGTPLTFGCRVCWPENADSAWAARGSWIVERWLADDSHFRVVVLGCAICSQRFVSAFMETVDWDDGEDPMYWSIIPVSNSEAQDLTRDNFHQFGSGRRSLFRAFPKGESIETRWATGVVMMPHD